MIDNINKWLELVNKFMEYQKQFNLDEVKVVLTTEDMEICLEMLYELKRLKEHKNE